MYGKYGEGDFGGEERIPPLNVFARPNLAVAPAQAGAHNHRENFVERLVVASARDDRSLGVWVPACAGTTSGR